MKYPIMYRTAYDEDHALVEGGFWTPKRAYAVYMFPDRPLFRCRLKPTAKVQSLPEFTTGWRFNELRKLKIDAAIFPSFTWENSVEIVLFNSKAVIGFKRIAEGKRS